MINGSHAISNTWVEGTGKVFTSFNPATGDILWRGNAATELEMNEAIHAAELAFPIWSSLSFEERLHYLSLFNDDLRINRAEFRDILSKETGKPLWEAETEIGAMINKLSISVQAYQDRCKSLEKELGEMVSITRHKPHGVIAVFGPFNLPGHLPNGHIIPALLAGNTVVFKPSELTPWVAQRMLESWHKANLPPGTINMVLGGKETGIILSRHTRIDGLMFTGSFDAGLSLSKQLSGYPQKILALEMGGNNPLIVHNPSNIKAAVYNTIQSAYITAGQRCSCARRLIVTRGPLGEKFVEELCTAIQNIVVGPYTDKPEPFMGPLISTEAVTRVINAYELLINQGAKVLVPLKKMKEGSAFLLPGLIEVTSIQNKIDEEIFGPLLQLSWVENFEEAIKEANATEYGLAAGLLCDDELLYKQFALKIRAGVVNWNRPLTGASSSAPFGGIGKSGNHRPSAYYAADFCAYPVASLEQRELVLPNELLPGIKL